MPSYLVMMLEKECDCFSCKNKTKLFLMEYGQPLCLDCIMTLVAVEYVGGPLPSHNPYANN